MMLNSVSHVEAKPGYKLHLAYTDGAKITVDLRPVIAQGGVFGPLTDPAVFSQVSIGDQGRYISWPGDIDLCVDALRLEGEASLPVDDTLLRAGTHD